MIWVNIFCSNACNRSTHSSWPAIGHLQWRSKRNAQATSSMCDGGWYHSLDLWFGQSSALLQ